jgi:type IV pilus assembly protein PilP
MIIRLFILMALGIVILSGCSSSNSQQDLKDFIAENKRRPPGKVPEPPRMEPYEAYVYDAYRLRSPFDQPIKVIEQQRVSTNSNVKPDLARQKERLEQYDLATLSMVGTLRKDGALWALVSDPEGGIERIRPGNYVGKNHGKVVGLDEDKIELLEIVASGKGWLERPNALELKSVEEN